MADELTSDSMKKIKHYVPSQPRKTLANSSSNNNTHPKGSKENPYSFEEYQSIPEEKWKGGYVVDLGYVGPYVIVDGSSSTSDAYSDPWSDPFGDPTSDLTSDDNYNLGADPEDEGGGGGGGDYNEPDNGDYDIWGTVNPSIAPTLIERVQQLKKQLPQPMQTALNTLNVKYTFNNNTSNGGHYDPKTKTINLPTDSICLEKLFHEALHAWQDFMGIMNLTTSHSCLEYEVYVITDIFCAYQFHMGNQFFFTACFTIQGRQNDYLDLISTCTNNGYIGASFFNYTYFMQHIGSFFEDFRQSRGTTRGSEAPDPNYSWNWEMYLRMLGFMN